MRKMSLMALLVGAALFTGLGVTSAMADSKCGAGKCGSSTPAKCGAEQKGKCGDGKAMTPGKCGTEKNSKCGAEQRGKCGDSNAMNPGKCGGEKKPEVKGKCGAGKCGK